MSEQPQQEQSSPPLSPSPIRMGSPSSSIQTAQSSPATPPLHLPLHLESNTIALAHLTSNPIIYPSQSAMRSPPRSPSGVLPKSPALELNAFPNTEDSSRKPKLVASQSDASSAQKLVASQSDASTKLPCPNKLAQEKPLPPRIIQISPNDFNAFREVLEQYKMRNLLVVSESKLTTREDIIAHFK